MDEEGGLYSLWPADKKFPQQFQFTMVLGVGRNWTPVNGWWGKYVSSWAHVPSMHLGLALCVWEEYLLVEIAWKVSESLFYSCHAITASGSPDTQDMLVNRVPPAGQNESPG